MSEKPVGASPPSSASASAQAPPAAYSAVASDSSVTAVSLPNGSRRSAAVRSAST